MLRTTPRGAHRAAGPAVIDYRALGRPIGRTVGGAAILSAVAAGAAAQGGDAARAEVPSAGLHGARTTTTSAAPSAAPAFTLSDVKLRPGARGEAVRQLQLALNHQGASISVDGSFGSATAKAVRQFQRGADLNADAVVGVRTRAALVATAPAAAPQPKLRRGDRGDAVRTLQRQLNAAGAGINVDGSFGPATNTAVRALQRSAGIGVDGVVGPRTWSALKGGSSAAAPAAKPSSKAPAPSAEAQPKLRRGDRGDAVRTLQRQLNERGAKINVDGSFGPSTRNAVRALQRSAGIGVDGVVGPRTWAAVNDRDTRISEPAASRGSDRPAPSSSSFDGQAVLAAARSQLGTPYKWGGSTSSGLDCSGLVHYAYNQAGFDVPRRTAKGYAFGGDVISQSEARVGDLVVFTSNNYGHIGIYAGDGRVVDASSSRQRVMERDIWSAPHVFVTYR